MIPQINIANTRPRTFSALNTLLRFHAYPEETDGKFCLIEATVPAGAGAPPHSHKGEMEAFFILEGRVKFMMGAIGPKEIVAEAGDYVPVPGAPCSINSSRMDGGLERTRTATIW